MNSHEEHMGMLGHRALECSDSGERAVVCKNTTGVLAFDLLSLSQEPHVGTVTHSIIPNILVFV